MEIIDAKNQLEDFKNILIGPSKYESTDAASSIKIYAGSSIFSLNAKTLLRIIIKIILVLNVIIKNYVILDTKTNSYKMSFSFLSLRKHAKSIKELLNIWK